MIENTVLFVIDMQKGLLNKEIYQKETLLGNINKLIGFFHSKGQPVIFIQHNNDSLLKLFSDDWMLDPEMAIGRNDLFINKTHSNVFEEKEFMPLLKAYGFQEGIVTGLVTNGCIKNACLGAKANSFPVILIRDAHSTFHNDPVGTIREWEQKLVAEGIPMMTTNEFMDANQ
jgi:nicotinamidase-related amidase